MQEFDLPQGTTLIGRSGICQVTLDDPLVSRQHARLVIEGDAASVEDLGSRNGVVVDGRRTTAKTVLRDGSRLRIGTQELVLNLSREAPQHVTFKDTGFMCHCAACSTPYPDKLAQCPTCGSVERRDEETLNGSTANHLLWSFELLAETAHRARTLRRWPEVERVLRRAQSQVDALLLAGQDVGTDKLRLLADAARAYSLEHRDPHWVQWAMTMYAAFGVAPYEDLAETLGAMPAPAAEGTASSGPIGDIRVTVAAPSPDAGRGQSGAG